MNTKKKTKFTSGSKTTPTARSYLFNYGNGSSAKSIKKSAFEVNAAINYSFYVSYTHRGLHQHGRHTKFICNELQLIEEKHARGLPSYTIIELPPRHSKSMTVTETFPSFFIGKNPNRRVIEVSYGDTLARKFGRANRDKIEEFGPAIFDINIDQRNSSATNWSIKGKRGGMISTGIGGAITGEGADLLIIDDPIKNRREADSPTYREFLWNEWQNTLQTRLQPAASVIIIMTRWHEDDLIGRLLEQDEREWNRIRLPAIAEEDERDLLNRAPGEALWPEYGFTTAWAETTKAAVGTRAWESLYQQNPRPPEGSLFKRSWLRYYNAPPAAFDEILQSWDCTFKDTKESDYVVGQVWGRNGQLFYLLDQVRGQMDFPATIAAIKNLSAKWPKAYTKLVEDKANGPAVISVLKNQISGLVPVNPEGGKITRASAASPSFESGNVFLPAPALAPWVNDYVEELIAFPKGKKDDQVDSTTQALIRMINPFTPLIGRG